jgi:hypothetical protein
MQYAAIPQIQNRLTSCDYTKLGAHHSTGGGN